MLINSDKIRVHYAEVERRLVNLIGFEILRKFCVALLACSAHSTVVIVNCYGTVARRGTETPLISRCLLVADQLMRRSDTRNVPDYRISAKDSSNE